MKGANTMPSQRAIEWAAQLWCLPENAKKEMDVKFAMSIAKELDKILDGA